MKDKSRPWPIVNFSLVIMINERLWIVYIMEQKIAR